MWRVKKSCEKLKIGVGATTTVRVGVGLQGWGDRYGPVKIYRAPAGKISTPETIKKI